jgi:hypothetical protein
MLSRLLPVLLWLSLSVPLTFVPAAPSPIKIYLIGDSTMSIKQMKAYPETG